MPKGDEDKWNFCADGQLSTGALLEWGVAAPTIHHIVLRIGYANSEEERKIYQEAERAPHQIQVSLTPNAAKELGAQLIIYAERST